MNNPFVIAGTLYGSVALCKKFRFYCRCYPKLVTSNKISIMELEDCDINLEDFPYGLPEEVKNTFGLGKTKTLPPMLVEDCFSISPGSFCRNLLHPLKTSISESGSLGNHPEELKSGTGLIF